LPIAAVSSLVQLAANSKVSIAFFRNSRYHCRPPCIEPFDFGATTGDFHLPYEHRIFSAMNIAKMMQQAQQMQEKMQTMQSDLAEKEVEATVGSGKLTVRANAAGEVLGIQIDPSLVDPDEVEILEDLVVTGVRQAIEQGKALAAEEMKAVTGGMDLPPGLGF
jgi:DNA-binding YbaB/EbfC family protein